MWTTITTLVDWRLVIPALSLIFAVSVYLLNRRKSRKSLSYSLSRVRVTDKDQHFGFALAVTYDNQPVEDVSIVRLEFLNDGGMEIKRTDFDGPLRISLPDTCNIMRAKLGQTNPPQMDADVEQINHHTVIVQPLLLNPRDIFEVIILANALRSASVQVSGRIAGVRQVVEKSSYDASRSVIFKESTAGGLVMGLGLGLIAIFLLALFPALSIPIIVIVGITWNVLFWRLSSGR